MHAHVYTELQKATRLMLRWLQAIDRPQMTHDIHVCAAVQKQDLQTFWDCSKAGLVHIWIVHNPHLGLHQAQSFYFEQLKQIALYLHATTLDVRQQCRQQQPYLIVVHKAFVCKTTPFITTHLFQRSAWGRCDYFLAMFKDHANELVGILIGSTPTLTKISWQ